MSVAQRCCSSTRRSISTGGRTSTVYVPPDPTQSVVYAVDGGWHIERLVRSLEGSAGGSSSTMVVGVHGLQDDDGRLQEYVEAFGGERFQSFEEFLVMEVRAWVHSDLSGGLPSERSAMWGASLGGEFALAMALRHPEMYGVALCASPGGGFTPASGRCLSCCRHVPGRRTAGTVVPRERVEGGPTHSPRPALGS